MQNPTNWIIDADISSYFDTVDHEWLVEMLELKVGDKQFIRLIKRFLKAGIVDEGLWRATKEGTPQGGIISPVLGNIYLHYVLDLWVEKAVRPWAEGFVALEIHLLQDRGVKKDAPSGFILSSRQSQIPSLL